jgi:hypothetical protein
MPNHENVEDRQNKKHDIGAKGSTVVLQLLLYRIKGIVLL